MYNAATSIFTALGNSKTPLYFLIFSSVLNIILDLLFVAKFKMGVNGVAYATLIAQGVSAVIAVIHLLCEVKKINSNGKYQIFSLQEFKKMSLIAIPSILQQSFLSVGQLCVQGLINSYGSDVVAGYSAAIKINTFMTTVETSFGNALSSYTSQNYGAGKYDRVKAGHISGLKILVTIAIVIPAFIFVFAPQLIELFVNADEGMNVINVGSGFLRVLAPFYFVVAIKLVTDGVLRGLGKMREFMIATFCDLILRVGGSFLLSMPVFGLKYLGIWWAYPLGWTIATILSVVLCLNVYKKTFNGEN
jgi:putative MATE family efflux protein